MQVGRGRTAHAQRAGRAGLGCCGERALGTLRYARASARRAAAVGGSAARGAHPRPHAVVRLGGSGQAGRGLNVTGGARNPCGPWRRSGACALWVRRLGGGGRGPGPWQGAAHACARHAQTRRTMLWHAQGGVRAQCRGAVRGDAGAQAVKERWRYGGGDGGACHGCSTQQIPQARTGAQGSYLKRRRCRASARPGPRAVAGGGGGPLAAPAAGRPAGPCFALPVH